MEKFATGNVRIYSGSNEVKEIKTAQNQAPDYAQWRIADWKSSWLQRRKANNIWHGLTVFNSDNQRIGHIVLGGGELAYFLVKAEWGKGYMSKAAAALVRIALPYIALNHKSIEVPEEINATVRTDHLASQTVLKRAGFVIDDETPQTQKYGHTRYEPVLTVAKLIRAYKQAMFDESYELSAASMMKQARFFSEQPSDSDETVQSSKRPTV